MTAHATRLRRSTSGPRSLTAPLEDLPAARHAATWIDRHDEKNRRYRVRTANAADHIPGTISVLTYRDYFNEYRAHPEYKALSPDGQQCHPWTRGPLQPPFIKAAPTLARIGKESLPGAADDPDPGEPLDAEIVYTERVCPVCGVPLSDRQRVCGDRCRKRATRPQRGRHAV